MRNNRCLLAGGLFLAVINVFAQPVAAIPGVSAKRPQFKSARHVPVSLTPAEAVLPSPGYELVFADEFTGGELDTGKWSYRTDAKMLSKQQPANVSVKDGLLRIDLRKETVAGKNYTGGGIISRQTFVYGYFEARFRTPAAEGWHTSFWTQKYGVGRPADAPPAWLEIDICEQDGGDPNFYSFGIINKFPDAAKGQTWSAGRWVVEDTPDTSADFHVWACEFTPDKIRFYFDGRLAKEESSAGFPHDDMNVWLTAIAATLKGDRWVDESKLPNAVSFDYVRVYQHPRYREAEQSVRAMAASRPVPAAAPRTLPSLPKDLN